MPFGGRITEPAGPAPIDAPGGKPQAEHAASRFELWPSGFGIRAQAPGQEMPTDPEHHTASRLNDRPAGPAARRIRPWEREAEGAFPRRQQWNICC